MKDYVFHYDWVTNVAPVWKKHLSHVAGLPGLRFLEIGSYEGRSAVWFLENILTHPSSTIVCIDKFFDGAAPEIEQSFHYNIQETGKSNQVFFQKGLSRDILPFHIRDSFDCIYIDGSHAGREVIEDAVFSFLLLKEEGTLIFDDYKWDLAEDTPRLAINSFLKIYRGKYFLLHKGYQVLVRKL